MHRGIIFILLCLESVIIPNSVTSIDDAAFIARTLAKRLTIDAAENPYADYNNDGKVNVADAAAIARYLAKAKNK